MSNAQHSSLSITLIISGPLGGQAPFSPAWGYSYGGAVEPVRLSIDWGDGTSNDLGGGCGNYCPSHTYNYPGTYTITIYITDSSGSSASDSKTITVYGSSFITVTSQTAYSFSVILTVTPLSGQAPFTPAVSTAWKGTYQPPATWVLYWGDGTSDDVIKCGENCPHTYNVPGTYTITFKVTDANGVTATDSKTITVYTSSFSVTLTVTPLSGQAPFTLTRWSTTYYDGQAPFTSVIYWGDGSSDDVSNCGQNCPNHTYTVPGTYTITVTVTDSSGKKASDSKTITVYGSSLTYTYENPTITTQTSSSQGATLIPPITNVCNPTLTILTIILAIMAGIVFIIVFRDWIFGLFGGAPFILAIIVAVFVAAVFIFARWNVCNPVVTILAVIIITIIIVWIFPRPRPRPPPALPPPGGNVTGNATVTGPGGGTTQLTNANLNQVGPGSTVETGPGSFVKAPTPQGSNSQSVIGQDSRVSWLDPDPNNPIPWLRFPGLSQIYNLGSLLLRLDFGKLLLSWVQATATQEAVIILPASLIGATAGAAVSRWLARIKGTMVLVEATKDGTSAAITVLEDASKPGSVELWRSDETGKVIEVHSGERVILKTGLPPANISVNLTPGLAQKIQDPFNLVHRWWALPPASDEALIALGSSQLQNAFCRKCGHQLPKTTSQFCTNCGAEQGNASSAGKCTNCGEPLRPGKKFCIKCGTPQS